MDKNQARMSTFWESARTVHVLHFAAHSQAVEATHSTLKFNDGEMTAMMVAERATLYGCRLVYLSSCELASELLIFGDDSFSLADAFIAAGAPSRV